MKILFTFKDSIYACWFHYIATENAIRTLAKAKKPRFLREGEKSLFSYKSHHYCAIVDVHSSPFINNTANLLFVWLQAKVCTWFLTMTRCLIMVPMRSFFLINDGI